MDSCKLDINSNHIIFDLHDYIEDPLLFKNIKYDDNHTCKKISFMTKSEFQKNHFLNIVPELKKFINDIHVIPNGINISEISEISEIKKDNGMNIYDKKKNLLISTSSSDRCVYALLKALPIIRKEIPDAEIWWAYGHIDSNRNDVKEFTYEIKKLISETPGFRDLGRLDQKKVWTMYKLADLFIYGTTFPEIDCISLTKAMVCGAIPVVSNTGSLYEKMIKVNSDFNLTKTEINNTTLDKSLKEGPIFDEWVSEIIKMLKNNSRSEEYRSKYIEEGLKYDWNIIVDKWVNILKEI